MGAHDVYVLPLRLIILLLCVALTIAALPLVIYLRAHDALDASADIMTV